MKILIDDGMQIQLGTGIGNYSLELYQNLKKYCQSTLDVDLISFERKHKSKLLDRLEYIKYINSDEYLRKTEEYDVIHYTNYLLPFKRHEGTKYVVTIHDLVAFLYPETLNFLYRYYNQFSIKYSIKKADKILTDSYSVKNDILKFWPKYSKKIEVIYPGIDYTNFKEKENIKCYENINLTNEIEKKKFFLFIGTIEKRKNIDFIIDAFIKLKEMPVSANYKLVLAGRLGYGADDFIKRVKLSKFTNDIIFTGYISNNDRRKLYNDAASYIFPSIYEGFGLPVIECMVYNLPLICSNIPTNNELAKEYGLFFDLKDINTLVKQMYNVIDKNYSDNKLKIVADEKLKLLNWENNIKNYKECYRNINIF